MIFITSVMDIMWLWTHATSVISNMSRERETIETCSSYQRTDYGLCGYKQVCLPSVVEEFLRQSSTLQLVDQSHWLASKERLDGNTRSMIVGDMRLDMFFPFDPYLLRHSDR